MSFEAKQITPEQLINETQQMFNDGYRFVTATCVDEIEQFRIIYSFDREMELVNLEVAIGKEEQLPSVSGVYLCAFLVENEIKELFGVNISDIAVDLGGHLYMIEGVDPHPMTRKAEKKAAKGVKKNG
ncbi:MAG: NADH-quinone oxidoreductase subunit C [Syntrophomonadaceae bacterium]|nr:NADH-quinone oxidoreductase subunit C [Syntrophomonadaceae bacterium]